MDKLVRWIDAEDRRFIAVVDAALAEAVSRGGAHLACRIGCTECCIGPFPITELDARRLRRGMALLAERDPARAGALLARARTAAALFGPADDDEVESEAFARAHEAVPCAALDPETGACELYEARPVSCRTFGPPVRIGDEALAPCRLCFTTATPAEIEDARMTVDKDGQEEALLDAVAQAGPSRRSTLVAFALAADPTTGGR